MEKPVFVLGTHLTCLGFLMHRRLVHTRKLLVPQQSAREMTASIASKVTQQLKVNLMYSHSNEDLAVGSPRAIFLFPAFLH